jgi:hypothetical protein
VANVCDPLEAFTIGIAAGGHAVLDVMKQMPSTSTAVAVLPTLGEEGFKL